MRDIFRTLLLLALPASGKSEVRKFLTTLGGETCARDLHLGALVELDDDPFVYLVRCIDEAAFRLAGFRLFFQAPDRPLLDPRMWGVYIRLLNLEFRGVMGNPGAEQLFNLIDRARKEVGLPSVFLKLDSGFCRELAAQVDAEVRKVLGSVKEVMAPSVGETLVVEFARGGPEGSIFPLPSPYGYAHSLSLLDPAILERAAILYVSVSPKESRRRNLARAKPGEQDSILFHGVPEAVMRKDYGLDDIRHLLQTSDRPGTIQVQGADGVVHLPCAVFDNEADLTSFVRDVPQNEWSDAQVSALRAGLSEACGRLWTSYTSQGHTL